EEAAYAVPGVLALDGGRAPGRGGRAPAPPPDRPGDGPGAARPLPLPRRRHRQRRRLRAGPPHPHRNRRGGGGDPRDALRVVTGAGRRDPGRGPGGGHPVLRAGLGSAVAALLLMYAGVLYASPQLAVAWSLRFGSLVLLVGLFAVVAARLYFLVAEEPLLKVLRGRKD